MQALPASAGTTRVSSVKPREITSHIVVHCSATAPDTDIGAAEIRCLHAGPKDRTILWNGKNIPCKGWSDIGYHYVIRRSGETEAGRDQDLQGAHVLGWNACSLGICLVGGGNGTFDYTRYQMDALKSLVLRLKCYYPDAVVLGHCDFLNSKTCPNFPVKLWWQEQRWRDEDFIEDTPTRPAA